MERNMDYETLRLVYSDVQNSVAIELSILLRIPLKYKLNSSPRIDHVPQKLRYFAKDFWATL